MQISQEPVRHRVDPSRLFVAREHWQMDLCSARTNTVLSEQAAWRADSDIRASHAESYKFKLLRSACPTRDRVKRCHVATRMDVQPAIE